MIYIIFRSSSFSRLLRSFIFIQNHVLSIVLLFLTFLRSLTFLPIYKELGSLLLKTETFESWGKYVFREDILYYGTREVQTFTIDRPEKRAFLIHFYHWQ